MEDNITVNRWGFLPEDDELRRCRAGDLEPGRIIRENRGQYMIACCDRILKGEVSGAFRYCAVERSDYPAVGDWVAFRKAGAVAESEGPALIERVFPRRSCFSRKAAGITTEEQVIAANIDVLFLVFAVNGGRNLTASGLERYLTLAYESGAEPVVVLNKADLVSEEDCAAAVITAEQAAPGAQVRPVSAATGAGIPSLTESLEPGTTIALAGPSGTGKSTIINALAGTVLQKTGEQRAADLRGRHTTTFRELFRLESGLMLIDTPGMRELQLWAGTESAEYVFTEISDYGQECRFSDCTHQGEPGCAVQAAVSAGEIELRRYENYLELRRELDYLHRRQDEQAAEKERRKWKNISKEIKRYNKNRR